MKLLVSDNYRKLAGKPRYPGQSQGDEYNPHALQDRYLDNEVVEGEHVKRLRQFWQENRMDSFNSYIEKLRADKHTENRIQTMISAATRGKIPGA